MTARPAGTRPTAPRAQLRPRARLAPGQIHDPTFVAPDEHAELVAWLETLHPIWEDRFTAKKAAASGQQRRLLRPVY